MKIPSEKECVELLGENNTPENVIAHSKAVCKAALEIADKLIAKGVSVNRELVLAAALLHDIERDKGNHAVKGAELINKLGFKEIAEISKKHGLHNLKKEEFQPKTIEEKILFYVDKIIEDDKLVTVEERFKGWSKEWCKEEEDNFHYDFVKKIEKELKQMME